MFEDFREPTGHRSIPTSGTFCSFTGPREDFGGWIEHDGISYQKKNGIMFLGKIWNLLASEHIHDYGIMAIEKRIKKQGGIAREGWSLVHYKVDSHGELYPANPVFE